MRGKGPYRLLDYLIVFLLAAMVVMVFGNVVLRFAFHSGIPASEELSRYAFVWLTFTGAIVGLREGLHLGVETIVCKLSLRGRRACRGISDALMIFCCVLFLIGSYHQTIANAGRQAQASGFPMVLLFSVGLVAGVLMIVVLVTDLVRLATGRMSEAELIQVRASE